MERYHIGQKGAFSKRFGAEKTEPDVPKQKRPQHSAYNMSGRHIQFEERRKKDLVKRFHIYVFPFREDNVKDEA